MPTFSPFLPDGDLEDSQPEDYRKVDSQVSPPHCPALLFPNPTWQFSSYFVSHDGRCLQQNTHGR